MVWCDLASGWVGDSLDLDLLYLCAFLFRFLLEYYTHSPVRIDK